MRQERQVKVGVPKEVKNHEYRVAITPIGVHELTSHGHEVFIQQDAGLSLSRSPRLAHPVRS